MIREGARNVNFGAATTRNGPWLQAGGVPRRLTFREVRLMSHAGTAFRQYFGIIHIAHIGMPLMRKSHESTNQGGHNEEPVAQAVSPTHHSLGWRLTFRFS
jgi:hypothetical protein